MIPKIIHHCWFSGDPLPPIYRRCVESWEKYLPEYELRLCTLENTAMDTPFLKHSLKKKQWAFISDYVRMRQLRDYGGIYLDMDIEVIRKLDDLLDNKCFIGNEAPNRPNPSVIASVKGHEFPKECMDIIDERFSSNKPYLIAPEVAMLALKRKPFKDKVTIYPEEYFYPYNPYDKTRGTEQLMYSDITGNTYAIHHWGKSWSQNIFSRALKKILPR